ncbi:MAG: ATP-binding cassette domain-containing protein [Candidatus Ferrigenium altingense]
MRELEMRRGEIFGLVGHDGAGKSTAMCLLTAFCCQQGCDGGLPYPGRRREAKNEQQLYG